MSQNMPSKGKLTFDAEGNDDPASPWYTRKLHWPGGASGVTIGRGYDMKTKSEAKIKGDLVAAGLSDTLAAKYAKGAKLEGADAKKFVADNKNTLTELTWDQQLSLFETTYNEHLADAKWRASADKAAGGCKEFGTVNWDALDSRIRDVVVDLRYRGDYKTSTYPKIQPHVVANDYAAFREAMLDAAFWKTDKGVPSDRFDRRVAYLPDEGGGDESDGDGDWNEIVPEKLRYESPCKGARPSDISKPTHIVIHITGTNDFKSVYNRFMTPKQASAHYLVDRDGNIHQFVRDADRAWHAGIQSARVKLYAKNDGSWRKYKVYFSWSSYPAGSKYLDASFNEVSDKATAQFVAKADGSHWSDYDYFEKRWGTTDEPYYFSQNKDPNNYSIGIELLSVGAAKAGADVYPEALYTGLDKLLTNLCKKYKIPRDRQHIIGHEDVDPCARWGWDPNQGFDWERVLQQSEPTSTEAEPEIDHGNTTAFELSTMTEDQRYDHLKSVWAAAQKRFGFEGNAEYDFQEANGRINLLSARGLLCSNLSPVANTRDAWDDTLFVIFKDKNGRKNVKTFTISTEPNDPKNTSHSSTLKAGMHKYVLGIHHKNKPYASLKDYLASYPSGYGYRALNPSGSGVITYIDSNRNLTEDPGENNINDAAINIHYGGDAGTSNWSWGCQVIKGWANYIALYRLIEADTSIKGSIKNELADKPASDGTRSVIYLLIEGTQLRPAATGYPLLGATPESLYSLNEKGDGGYFPIGVNNFWHGGIHLDTDSPLVAVADGEVVAYRISQQPLSVQLGGSSMPLSNSFVLLRHKRKTPKGQAIDFFSLYMHTRPLGTYTDAQKSAAPSPFKKRTFIVRTAEDGKGLNIRDGNDGKTILGVIPKDMHFKAMPDEAAAWNSAYKKVSYENIEGYAYLKDRAVKVADKTYQCITAEDTPKDTSKMGLNVRETGSGSKVLRVLPKGTPLKFKLPHTVAPGNQLVAGWFELEDGGWVYVRAGSNPTIEFSFVLQPAALDSVVAPDPPIPITAGSIVGYPGPYLIRAETVHFEIITPDIAFMDNPKKDEGGPQMLEIPAGTVFKKRTPPDVESITVNLPKGTRLALNSRHGTHREVSAHEISGWTARSKLGSYDAATKSYTLDAPLASLTTQAGGGDSVSIAAPKGATLRFLEQSGDQRRVHYELPEAEQTKKTGWAPLSALGKWDEADQVFELEAPLPKLFKTAPPETFEFKEDAGKNEEELFPLVPPAGSPSIAWDKGGHAWYEIEFAPGQMGWADPDQPGIQKKGVYDWPRWKKVEEQGQYSHDGICDATEILSLIDADKDGNVTSAELKNALAVPAVAAKLRRIACKHPTEWSGTVEGLDRLAEAPWYMSKADLEITKGYIRKLGFWDDVKKAGLPPKEGVWNLHPVGFLEHLQWLTRAPAVACNGCKINIWQKFKEEALEESNTHLIQLVAEAPFKSSFPMMGTDKAVKKAQTNYEMLRNWKRHGWEDFIKAYRKKDKKDAENKTPTPEEAEKSFELGITGASGEIGLNAELVSAVDCRASTHSLKVRDSKGKETVLDPLGAKFSLRYDGPAAGPDTVVPARYNLEGAVCGGDRAATTIEVFPASSLVWEFEIAKKLEPWQKITDGLKTVTKLVGGEFELTASGSVAGFFGWRTEGFRAYYAYEIAGKGGIKIEYSYKFSFLQFFTGVPIPESFRKYVGDIGLSFEIAGSISLALKVELREFAKGATDLGWEPNLSLTLKLGIDVAVGLYAMLNAVIFSAEATGKVKCGVSGGGKLGWKKKKITLTPFATLEEGDIVVSVTLKSMISKHEKEWVFPLWPAKELLKDDSGKDKYQWVIYDYSKK